MKLDDRVDQSKKLKKQYEREMVDMERDLQQLEVNCRPHSRWHWSSAAPRLAKSRCAWKVSTTSARSSSERAVLSGRHWTWSLFKTQVEEELFLLYLFCCFTLTDMSYASARNTFTSQVNQLSDLAVSLRRAATDRTLQASAVSFTLLVLKWLWRHTGRTPTAKRLATSDG